MGWRIGHISVLLKMLQFMRKRLDKYHVWINCLISGLNCLISYLVTEVKPNNLCPLNWINCFCCHKQQKWVLKYPDWWSKLPIYIHAIAFRRKYNTSNVQGHKMWAVKNSLLAKCLVYDVLDTKQKFVRIYQIFVFFWNLF